MKENSQKSSRAATPLLTLCTIVRDEAANLPGCLVSVRGVVDEIVIADTGSADGTPELACRLGAKVVRIPWRDDFAAARNEALRHAAGRWVLWLDADERLLPADRRRVRPLLRPGPVGAYLVEILNHLPGGEAQRSTGHRLFRRVPGVRFEGRVHEQIAPSVERLGLQIRRADFVIEHWGYAQDAEAMAGKHRRNLALLREQLRGDPGDSYTLLQIAQTLMQLQDYAGAEAALQEALSARPLPPDLMAALHSNRAECRLKRADPAGALRACADSLAIFPEQIMANILGSRACAALEDHRRATEYLLAARRAVLAPAPVGSRPAIEPCISVERIDRVIQAYNARASPRDPPPPEGPALRRLSQGDLEGALEDLRRLQEQQPEDPVVRRYMAGVLTKLGRRDEAVACLTPADPRAP